jgi:indolepyruvate ferredoxin oxidoreductase beta subunit
MTEKIALEDGRVDSDKLIEAGEKAAKRFVHGDFASIASATGSVISAALFGALAATQALPFTRSQFEDAIRRGGVGVESSLAAFAAGLAAASGSSSTHAAAISAVRSKVGPKLQAEVQRIEREFPAAAHEFILSGVQRLADYQDRAYATEFLNLLQRVRDADTQYGDGTFALLRETARYLALWMTYEDAVRVADLKIRRTRFQRVQKDSRAAANQVVQIHEFLHPGVEEITDILPAWLGRWILRSKWMSARIESSTKRGMIVQTTSLRGFLQLYVLANLRRWRRKSLRFGEEHRRIAEWLALLPTLAQENYALALEVAEYPNVIKGYGETHLRGRKSFDAMLAVLPKLRGKNDSAARLKKLREASVADDTGAKLAETLQEVTR